ncbi:MAG TPA: MFS transporter [Rhizomicrobium sp.]|nr:MFS transporter [Rhizomicrobium sp.]
MSAATRVGGVSRRYILFMLMLVYVVNYIDRTVLNILLPAIKAEFHLSDAALGLLSGTAFALFYATLGIPLAWLADRVNRRNIIAASMALFSTMTVFSGLSTNFVTLVLARLGTGIGEAGTSPPVNSIISDLYEPKERASALSFYAMGLNIGLLLSSYGGGWVDQHYGWRVAFLCAGAPGLLLTLLILFTVPEPKRGQVERLADSGVTPPISETIRYLFAIPSFRFMAAGCALSAFGGYAGAAFIPVFLARNHHLTPSEVGLALAVLFGVVGGLGTYFSGVLADKLGARDVRWNMNVIALAIVIAVPFFPIYYLSSNLPLVLFAGIFPTAIGAAYIAPAYAMVQSLVPLRMRAQAAAFLLFILNIIGFGLGPLLVGMFSDALTPTFGVDSLRWSLLATGITWIISAAMYWFASRHLKSDLEKARMPQAGMQQEVAT